MYAGLKKLTVKFVWGDRYTAPYFVVSCGKSTGHCGQSPILMLWAGFQLQIGLKPTSTTVVRLLWVVCSQ